VAFRLTRGAKGLLPAKQARRPWTDGEVIWGVPRRPSHDDLDDPKAHAGLAQHAFEPGNDERAICGFEPAKRASGPSAPPRPQLAMPSPRLNPRCAKCAGLVASPATATQPLVVPSPVDQPVLVDQPAIPVPPPPPAPGGARPTAVAEPAQATPTGPLRGEGWEGTATFIPGQLLAMVRPPSQPGLGVVASVISGPSGTRVSSVRIDDDGIAVITLSEPAGGPVRVAWFVVPAVDQDNGEEVPDGGVDGAIN
jgi:hypothetical protein